MGTFTAIPCLLNDHFIFGINNYVLLHWLNPKLGTRHIYSIPTFLSVNMIYGIIPKKKKGQLLYEIRDRHYE